MSHAYHHALSSIRKFPRVQPFEKHLQIHQFIDQSKIILGNATHRALLHHKEGAELTARWGSRELRLEKQDVLDIALLHITEDMGTIPAAEDWLRNYPRETRDTLLPDALLQIQHLNRKEGQPENDNEIIEILAAAPLLWVNSAGPFLAEYALGVTGSKNRMTRKTTEEIVKKAALLTKNPDGYPSFHDIACKIPLEPWMYDKAEPLPQS